VRVHAFVTFIAVLLLSPNADAFKGENGEMGLEIHSVQRRYGLDSGGFANGYGIGVAQHTHFGEKFGTNVGLTFSTGTDARGFWRTDLEFLLPGFAFRIPVKGDVQPYLATGFVMTASFFNSAGFMYAGNVSGVGIEWRQDDKLSWILEVDATIRGRFAVDKKDRPLLENDPFFNRHTRVVHEVSIKIGAILF
jgi:hypothetical protein